MSRRALIACTITVDGVEQDVEARAHVAVERGLGRSGGAGAHVDGAVEVVLVGGEWRDADEFTISASDRERLSDLLCEAALDNWHDDEQLRAERDAAAQERAQEMAREDRRAAR